MNGKLKKLRIRFGMEGYGLYWYCLEIITAKVDQFNLNFDLDHDAEIIAHDIGLHFDQVQEMMVFMVNLGLFENVDGTITCLKLARRIDQSMTSNSGMRNLIKTLNNHDSVMTKSSQNRTEQNRKRTLGQKTHFDLFWETYPKKVKRKKAVEIWKRKKLDTIAQQITEDIKNRLANDGRWLDGFVPDPTTYLNGERWEDEIQKQTSRKPEMNSQSQILRVGAQRGLSPRPGETNEQYETRIRMTRP
jgi:Lin1244/Lin1753-like, N-terminal